MMMDSSSAAACADITVRFFHHLDRRNYDAVAALIADDGIWHRQGSDLVGPASVLGALQARPDTLVTRHLVNNVVVDGADDRAARVSYELSVFVQEAMAKPRHLAVMTGADLLERQGAHWRIKRKKAEILFKFD